MILLAWFDHLEESFSYKEVQFKYFYPPMKTSCPPAQNVNKTPACVLKCKSKAFFVFQIQITAHLVKFSLITSQVACSLGVADGIGK